MPGEPHLSQWRGGQTGCLDTPAEVWELTIFNVGRRVGL
jgi:hypothetical protein